MTTQIHTLHRPAPPATPRSRGFRNRIRRRIPDSWSSTTRIGLPTSPRTVAPWSSALPARP